MDNQNTSVNASAQSSDDVLILVLMDNQNTDCNGYRHFRNGCLNPCSNG